ncbi:Disintegrin and metalloproteinase domain-containing protein 25 [Cricetulus griseus]|uniref:Disintegrin and metalloproteinase domain-containing protein 25 n=1 Tax=Cricetulus griseus TaxID=10029 RepID=G3GZB8_CRIGR|nr:Disintegrin and metalloproteinase domain-containing protein 25 [Cricetulus griseus]
MWAMGWLTYSLHFGGQRHVIYMKANKFFMSRHLSVFTYTDQGSLHKEQPFVQKDCYYHGYMDGDPESMVVLTTCFGGIQGTLQVNGTVYEIKPKNLSSTFEHLVHKIDNEETKLLPMRCALTEEEIALQMKLQETDNHTLMQSSYEGWWAHKRFLNLVLVVDHERIRYLNSNLSHVLREILIIVHAIHEIFLTLDVEVVLFGVEMWNAGNQVKVTTIDHLLRDFCYWKWISLNNRIQNDIAHLFVKHDFGSKNGLADVGSVCVQSKNCGVDRLEGSELHHFGQLTAHGIGHNLGLKHDEHTYCKIMPLGTMCREPANECDLPEWCDGHSHECPNDVYLLDGSSCKDGGYCYEKRCNSRDEQCQQIFGKEARSAAQSCYREINTQGDRFGNCGIFRSTYLRCKDSDILCGRVQCENVKVIPTLEGHSTVHWIHLNGVTCWGTDYHFGMTIPDIGHVKDGTDCGPEHVCIDRKCVNKSVWVSDCSPKTCNSNGVCNNLHHCHCNLGWDPPECFTNGSGGSIDSGPPSPAPKQRQPTRKDSPNYYMNSLILLAIFPCFVYACFHNRYVTSSREEEPAVSTSEAEEESSDVSSASKIS